MQMLLSDPIIAVCFHLLGRTIFFNNISSRIRVFANVRYLTSVLLKHPKLFFQPFPFKPGKYYGNNHQSTNRRKLHEKAGNRLLRLKSTKFLLVENSIDSAYAQTKKEKWKTKRPLPVFPLRYLWPIRFAHHLLRALLYSSTARTSAIIIFDCFQYYECLLNVT